MTFEQQIAEINQTALAQYRKKQQSVSDTLVFSISEHERETLDAWLEEHKPICTVVLKAAARGRLTFHFTPTTIGVVTHVSCACGDRIDVTDYGSW